MASTINLVQTVIWSAPFLHYQPQTIKGEEPALTSANIIRSTILGPPFTWPWNRVESEPIVLTAGTQDYVVSLPDFGFLEKAWVTTGEEIKEIIVKRALTKSSFKATPEYVAVQLQDGAGNITVRFLQPPSVDGTAVLVYQRKSFPMTSTFNRWDPIPDELNHIYSPGYLAMAMLMTGDARFPIFNDRFVAHLLGSQDGLDEMQKNIFIANWTDYTRQVQSNALRNQQGIGSRAK